MASRLDTLDEKIEVAKEKVLKYKDKYEKAKEELLNLQNLKNEMKRKQLLEAIENSGKSFEEIIAFLK